MKKSLLVLLLLVTTVILSATQFTAIRTNGGSPVQSRDEAWIHYDGANNDGIGTGEANVTFEVAARLTNDELADYAEGEITFVQFYVTDSAQAVTIKIYQGGSATDPGTVAYEYEVTDLVVNAWYEHQLTTPLTIVENTEYWVGYAVTSTGAGYPAGCDAGPGVADKGSKIKFNGTWSNLGDISELDCNWNIRTYCVGVPNEHDIKFVEFVNTPVQADPATDYTPTFKIKNIGLVAETISANVTISDFEGNEVYNETVSDIAIALDEEIEQAFPGFAQTAGEIYTVNASAILDTDEDNTNNEGTFNYNTYNTPRQKVVIEKATGTWCGYCPGAAMGVAEMHANNLAIAPIAYHAANGDPYETIESATRINYYGYTSFPSVAFDGGNDVIGGSADQSLYSAYLPIYEERMAIKTPMSIEIREAADRANFEFEVVVTKTAQMPNANIRLMVALTESDIQFPWQGQPELNEVFRAMYPSIEGTVVEFDDANEFVLPITLTSGATWNNDNCEIIAFVQNVDTKEIYQGEMAELAGFEIVANDNVNNDVITASISNYPNPFNPETTISFNVPQNGNVKVEVFNVKGQLVKTLVNETMNAGAQTIKWNGLDNNNNTVSTGVYFSRMSAGNKVVTSKMVLLK